MEQIAIIHRKSQAEFPLSLREKGHWKTCLRQLIFLQDEELSHLKSETLPSDQIYTGESALCFLLEILCGLHSPIVGETEVFGQFRAFVEEQKTLDNFLFSDHQKWLQFVIAEVKKTRSERLIGIGSQSYGSLLRRLTKDDASVAICGSGQLAQEIIPWISAKPLVQVFCRRPDNIATFAQKYPQLDIQSYSDAQMDSQVLVIAAPLSDQTIENLLKTSSTPVSAIYDLRGELNQLEELLEDEFPSVHYTSLKEFFAQIQELKKETQSLINSIKSELKFKSTNFVNRFELRPLGWDDICA